MAEKHFTETTKALFEGMEQFVTTKTVVGDAIRVDDHTIILPLIDVSCGMAAGTFNRTAKDGEAGGLSAKMSPTALLVIQNGATRLISIKNQDAVSKVVDMVPELINRFTGKNQISEDAEKKAEEIAESYRVEDKKSAAKPGKKPEEKPEKKA